MTIDAAQAIADGTWPETSARLDAEDSARAARLTSATALAEAAAWYCSRGVAVFPLRPREKRPAIPSAHFLERGVADWACHGECDKDGHGFYDATTDPDTVAAWWRRWPQANIGAPTGLRFDVIDVDGPIGVRNIAPYVEGIRARSIGLVSTPRPGGLHYFVPPDPEHKNSASEKTMLYKVDTRALGGYVVLPPSVTDEHGPDRRYTWLRPIEVTWA